MVVVGKTRRRGLKELMRVAGVKEVNSEVVGYVIGPRLNAAGRMKGAGVALDLLLAEEGAEAYALAKELDGLNRVRKDEQERVMAEVEEMGVGERAVICVRGEWHEGVIGIVAGRLVEKYGRPCFVFAKCREGWKGSGRSFGEFNLAVALAECQDCLVRGGGHSFAAGVTVAGGDYDKFEEAVNRHYEKLGLKNQGRFLRVVEDVVVEDIAQISEEFVGEMMEMEPFGEGNAEPVFLLRGVLVLESRGVGAEGKHLRLVVRDRGGNIMKCMGFGADKRWFVDEGVRVDVWVRVVMSEWNGVRGVEGRVVEVGEPL
jgi:single-stranded-DNA-specific exonuclease